MFYSVSFCLVSKKFKKVCQECSHTPGFEHLLNQFGTSFALCGGAYDLTPGYNVEATHTIIEWKEAGAATHVLS